MKERLLIFTRTMKLGGTEKVVCQMCKYLKDEFEEIVVCSSGGVNVSFIEALGIQHYQIYDICDHNPIHFLYNFFNVVSIIKKERITVVHSQHRMASFYTRLISAFLKFKKVYTAHNTFHDKHWLTKWSLENTSIIAVGEAVKDNFTNEYGFPESQITVLHNCIEPRNYDVLYNDDIQKARKIGKVVVTNIGRLSEQKGMYYFINAAEKLSKKGSKYHFFIAGDGELADQLKKQVEKNQLQNCVTFLGYQSDIFSIISQSDIIVLSSLWEGFPLTPIEVFSEKKPIIATKVDGTPEIVKDRYNGLLIEPKNSDDIVSAILLLSNDRQLLHAIESNGYSDYIHMYSMDVFMAQYVGFYKGLLI